MLTKSDISTKKLKSINANESMLVISLKTFQSFEIF
jgi:hypothetical protein